MQEIRIYHSIWRTLLFTLGCAAFVVMAFTIIVDSQSSRFMQVVGIVGLLFFGLGLFVIPFMTIRERITGKAYITITDKSIIVRASTSFIINFSDVMSFDIAKMGKHNFVAIHYKPNVEIQKFEDASFFGRLARRLNTNLTGAQENLTTEGTNIKTEELLKILNERLKRA